jgi:tetratricopeptide (TPR) repeat protein
MCFAALLFLFLHQGKEALEQAWQLASRGDRVGSEAVLQKLLAANAGDTDAHLLYGNLLAEDGKKDESLAQLKIAVAQRPSSPEAWNSLGEAYDRFGERREALDAFERATRAGPNFGIAQSNLARSLYEAGQKTQAKSHALRARSLLAGSKDLAEADYLLGKLELEAGTTRKAADYLTEAVRLMPDLSSAWSDLGQAKKLLLDHTGALAAFERAVQIDPDDPVAQYRLGAEYLQEGKPAEAISHLEASLRMNGEDQSTLNALAVALQRSNRFEEAAQTRQKLSAVIRNRDLESQNALAALRLNNRGAELEKAGKLTEAVDLYRQAVDLNGKHPGIRLNYAVALLRLGRWREGLEQMQVAQQLDPDNKQIETALKDAVSQAPAKDLPDWARSMRD